MIDEMKMTELLLWQIAFHLIGPTILGKTESQSLGTLPMRVRTSVLSVVDAHVPNAVEFERGSDILPEPSVGHTWIRNWRFRNASLTKALEASSKREQPPFSSLDAFFNTNRLFDHDAQGRDIHVAERAFVNEVFWPLMGLSGLAEIKAQVGIVDEEGGRRAIDFVLYGEKQYAIEIEGREFHDEDLIGPDRFDDEKLRQRSLRAAGYEYVPFSWRDIVSGRALTSLAHILLSLIHI